MVEINGTQYKLCLLDTNVISEIIKNRHSEFQKYMNNLLPEKYVPCFSAFSMVELRQTPKLFSQFLDIFSIFPSVILKGHGQILEEEIKNYPDYHRITPLLLSLVGIKPYKTLSKRQTIELLFETEPFVTYSKMHIANRNSDLSEFIANAQTFLPQNDKYSEGEILTHIHSFSLLQIYLKNKAFLEERRTNNGLELDINAFPSLLMMAYTTFYKFYEDRRRISSKSDIFDIAISALFPYTDAVITERHEAEVIKKIRSRDKSFLPDLKVWTLKDLREF